jgi:hypothetical protein
MNRHIPLAVLLICTALTAPAAAGFRSFYGANGSYAGGAITRNGYTTFTNRNGAYVGSSLTRGNTTTLYGRRGSRAGSFTRIGR